MSERFTEEELAKIRDNIISLGRTETALGTLMLIDDNYAYRRASRQIHQSIGPDWPWRTTDPIESYDLEQDLFEFGLARGIPEPIFRAKLPSLVLPFKDRRVRGYSAYRGIYRSLTFVKLPEKELYVVKTTKTRCGYLGRDLSRVFLRFNKQE